MNCVTRGFYSFRKSSEIKFENGSVVQLLPRGVGHSGLPAGVTRKRGVPGYCASAKFTIARSKLSAFSRSCGRIIRHETDPKECGLEVSMARVLTWVSDQQLTGWACSACDWNFPLPSLLSDPEAKKAYDRLASAKFQRHDCATHQPVASLNPESFIARAKGLVMRGFKPKDAAEITAKEIMFENHDDPDIARKVQIEVNDFLRRVKEGLI